jgi:hypothetical protein
MEILRELTPTTYPGATHLASRAEHREPDIDASAIEERECNVVQAYFCKPRLSIYSKIP